MPISTLEPVNGLVDNLSREVPTAKALQANAVHKKSIHDFHQLTVQTAPCSITEFIDHQIRLRPEAPAVHFQSDKATTYDELGKLSERIAHVLSIQKGTIVPICMDVSIDLIGTILAVLRSGAAYVILDPMGPTDRNVGIAESCNADIVVVDERFSTLYRRGIALRTALSQFDPRDVRSQSHVDVAASDLAYLIYTSGSTGTPKGVTHTHAAATHGIENFSLRGRSRWLLFYNPTFSAAQRTILATLSKGACLCLASREKLATSLPEVVQDMQVDALGVTPSGLSLLSPAALPPCLKLITSVGEPLSQQAVDDWAEKVDLYVSYGLSECAQLNFSRRTYKGDNPRVVGSPRDTTQAIILQPGTLIEAHEGTPGELCLAGPQVARGYYGRPEETLASFLKDVSGYQRLYRTGDKAIRHHDRTYEILGRLDDQVKINGQRLEPGEVTSNLLKNPNVAATAVVSVVIKERTSLVAAVVPKDPGQWSSLIQALRHQAQTSLPSFMVPSYWMEMTSLPTNANGKVDLPHLRSLAQQSDVEKLLGEALCDGEVADGPWNDLELALQETWARILRLNVKSITRSSSFIALGGTSLDAIQVVRDLRSQGLSIELADILRTSRLSDINIKSLADAASIGFSAGHLQKLSLVNDNETRGKLERDMGVVDAYPPTPFQASLLASTLQGNPDYLYQRIFDVRELDHVKLRLAFQVVFSASEILRTTFIHSGPGLLQVIRNDFSFPWNESPESLETFKPKDKAMGFRLDEPFARFTILHKQILVVSIHHTLFDFWSHRFLYEDVASLYLGFQPIARPSFRSFVYFLQQADPRPADIFWSSYLKDSEPSILNHTPSTENFQRTRYVHVNYKPTVRALGVTSGALMYTAWAIVLARHTGQSEAVFATTIAGRETPVDDIHLVDGPTMTVVPQLVKLDPAASVAQVVQATHDSFWDVLKHSQHGMKRSLTASAKQTGQLFDTLVNILVQDDVQKRFADKLFQVYGPKPHWQTEWTSLDVEENPDGFLFRLSSCMSEQKIDFILEQLAAVICTMVRDVDASIESIDVLGHAERQWLIGSSEAVGASFRTLHGGFETIVEKCADKVALQWQKGVSFTYLELEAMTNQMAFFLIRQGIKANDLVPILLDKSPIMIITIIALLKIGAAYVPLSPENPPDRNLLIIQEIKANSVLTESAHEDVFADEGITSVLLDRVDLSSLPTNKPEYQVSPDQLAYIIYTSGSTGIPKGVMIKHRSVAAAMDSIVAFESRVHSECRTLQFSNYIFDASVYDIFSTLSSGHTLCMAPTDRLLSDLTTVIDEMAVSRCFLTPTVARLLDPESVPTLKALIVGGEPITPDIVEAWSNDHTLINAYGPTETSILVTMTLMDQRSNPRVIGRPFPTVKAFIVESRGLRLLPWGAIGEICFSGPQLGEGYLQKPQQTADAFLENSIGGISRIYRTGDLGRWLPSGELEYLGRKDNQIKVNGYRIELGEIEQVIKKAGCVKDVVVVLDDQKAKPQLVSFVVFCQGELGSSSSLQPYSEQLDDIKHAMKSLAHYMVPKFVIPRPSMPTLPSGKTNRKELKAVACSMNAIELSRYAFDSPAVQEPVKPPVTDEERTLQHQWARLLGIDKNQFGLEANFLLLGGDSIAAINLASNLRKIGYGISVGEALSSANLKDMAACMEKRGSVSLRETQSFEPSHEVQMAMNSYSIDKTKYKCVYPCPPGQAEFLSQGAQDEQFWVVMIARKLPKTTNIDAWIHTAEKLAAVNDILRTTFFRYREEWFGAVLLDPTPLVHLEEALNAEARTEILNRMWQQRFVTGQPFLRYVFMRMSDGSYEVVIKMDHGLYDGTLLRVFDDHFKAFQRGQPVPEFTSFNDFATHIWSSDRQISLNFWAESNHRPTNFQYPNIRKPTINAVQLLTTYLQVDTFATKIGQTPAIVFQVAFQIWLARQTGRKHISFDYLYTGRNVDLPNPQSINGTCANFLPLRSHIDPTHTVKHYLTLSNAAFWEATENGNVALDDIYRACGLEREQVQNKALFLFQPFDPPSDIGTVEEGMKWVVMAESDVKMPQPYGVVVEVSRLKEGYRVKFGYDGRVFDELEAGQAVKDLEGIVGALMEVDVEETKLRALIEDFEEH